MSRNLTQITLGFVGLLVPFAWWQQDALIVGLAGLIPFFAGRHNDTRVN